MPLLFLSLTGRARLYSVRLPEQDNMANPAGVKALRRLFGQETDTSIMLQELARLKRIHKGRRAVVFGYVT